MRREYPKRPKVTPVYPQKYKSGKLSLYSIEQGTATCMNMCQGVSGGIYQVARRNCSWGRRDAQGIGFQCHHRGEWGALPTLSSGSAAKGSLGQCVDFWRDELVASPWVLDIVMHGYVLPLLMEPAAYARPNQQSALDEVAFVHTAVAKL